MYLDPQLWRYRPEYDKYVHGCVRRGLIICHDFGPNWPRAQPTVALLASGQAKSGPQSPLAEFKARSPAQPAQAFRPLSPDRA
jgi:hypothetical protein